MIETKTTKEISILHQNYRDYDDIIWVGLESLKKEIQNKKRPLIENDILSGAYNSAITDIIYLLCNSHDEKGYEKNEK